MGYKEEIFDRAELQFGDISEAVSWLRGFKNKTQNKYTRAALSLVDPAIEKDNIIVEAKAAQTVNDLYDLRTRANKISFVPIRTPALDEVNSRIRLFEADIQVALQEEQVIVNQIADSVQQNIEIADLSREEKRDLLEGNEQERRSAIRALRQQSPQSLGGFRRAEIRRGIAALADFDKLV